MAVRVAADVGGTFTDLYAVDDERGLRWAAKVPSTPEDPSLGIVRGLSRVLELSGLQPAQVSHFIHGTTVATNTVIQRKGAKTALLTTRGFRDVLEIGRQKRPHLYDISRDKVKPLVTRDLRFEVTERVLASGEVAVPLGEDDVRTAAQRLGGAGVQAVAVSFLHAYRFAQHELVAAEILRDLLPGVYVSCSSEVLPEFREYERTTTTVLNAYLGPVVSSYVERLKGRFREAGVRAPISIVQSSGGICSADVASRKPVYLLLSGPSAGVTGAAALAGAAGFRDVITFDMGGTSTDVALVVNG
ncbi:MAG: hydantoinase/oxoprolinase family protein, partial [Bacillota bacterium]